MNINDQVDEQLALASYSTQSNHFKSSESRRSQSVPTLQHQPSSHDITMTEGHYLPLQPIRGWIRAQHQWEHWTEYRQTRMKLRWWRQTQKNPDTFTCRREIWETLTPTWIVHVNLGNMWKLHLKLGKKSGIDIFPNISHLLHRCIKLLSDKGWN